MCLGGRGGGRGTPRGGRGGTPRGGRGGSFGTGANKIDVTAGSANKKKTFGDD